MLNILLRPETEMEQIIQLIPLLITTKMSPSTSSLVKKL